MKRRICGLSPVIWSTEQKVENYYQLSFHTAPLEGHNVNVTDSF